jgi:hypothetical protein
MQKKVVKKAKFYFEALFFLSPGVVFLRPAQSA